MKRLKKIFCIVLALCLTLPFAACGGSDLEAPTGVDLDEEYLLAWEEVDAARQYEVEITETGKGETTVESTRRTNYSLSGLEEGEYRVRIRSVGGQDNANRSEWTEYYDFTKEKESGLVYTLINNNTEYRVTKVGAARGDVEIEDTYRNKPVTEIADAAFRSAGSSVTSIKIGGNVRAIGNSAFYNCTGLISVTMGDSVLAIGDSAFQNCSKLETVTLSAELTAIPDYLFAYCRSLKEITIGEKVVSIGESAFTNCTAIGELSFPDSLYSIGEYAFNEADALATVTFGSGIGNISEYAFYGCGALTGLHFPERLADGVSLSVGNYAFADCDLLEEAVLPEGTTSVGRGCFSYCEKFTAVDFPDSLESLGTGVFDDTPLLAAQEGEDLFYADHWVLSISDDYYKEVVTLNSRIFDAGTVGIADYAFIKLNAEGTAYAGCPKLSILELPTSIKYIGAYAFYNTPALGQFAVTGSHSALKRVGNYAFANCNVLLTLKLNEGLEEIGQYAFYQCTMLNNYFANPHYIVPSTVKRVGSYAFRNAGLWSSPAEDGVIYAGNWAVGFNGSPTEVTLQPPGDGNRIERIEGIADYAFYNAQQLTSVGNLALASRIGAGAFYGCTSLANVSLSSNLEKIGAYTFYNCTSLWNINFPTRLTTIDRYAFYNCAGLLRLDLSTVRSDGISIGTRAFYGCVSLGSVNFGARVTSIGTRAFYGCASLANLTIPGSVKEIGDSAFAKCTSIGTLTLGDGVETIGDHAFRSVKIDAIKLPDSVKKVGFCAFYEAIGCTSIDLGRGVQEIGDYAFGLNAVRGTIVLPASLKTIGSCAFAGCIYLQSVFFRGKADLGLHAFYLCPALTIYSEKGVELTEGTWNSSFRPMVPNCTFSPDGSYLVSLTTGGVRYSTALGGLADPYREGFDFVGWATEEGGEAVYGMGDLAGLPEGLTLYATYRFHVEEEDSAEPEPAQE